MWFIVGIVALVLLYGLFWAVIYTLSAIFAIIALIVRLILHIFGGDNA